MLKRLLDKLRHGNASLFGGSLGALQKLGIYLDRLGCHGRMVAGGGAGIGSEWPHNRKRPAGEAGRFWGYYREERYVSLYMCGSVGGR